MTEIPIAPLKRMIKNSGADRCSNDSAEALSIILEDVGTQLSQIAWEYAKHAGRKTVKTEDIQLAAETLL